MIDRLFSIASLALIVTGVGIAFRKGSAAPDVIKATTGGLAQIQTAAYGPK